MLKQFRGIRGLMKAGCQHLWERVSHPGSQKQFQTHVHFFVIIFCGFCDIETIWHSFADGDGKCLLEASWGSYD